jgi:hypothetical protein
MRILSCPRAPRCAAIRVALAAVGLGCSVLLAPASAIPPELIVTVSQTTDEGAELDLSGMGGALPIGVFFDADLMDMHDATVNWGDGTSPQMADIFLGPGFSYVGGSHHYADDGQYLVTVTVTDDNGESDSGSFETFVGNVTPSLAVTPSAVSINEGQTVSFAAAFDDPGFDNPFNPTLPILGNPFNESFRYFVDWGDGRDIVASAPVADINGGPGIASTGMFNGSHTYADDGSYTVRVRLADDNMTGNFSSGVAGVDFVESVFSTSVGNVVPTLSVTPTSPTSINAGGTVTFDAAFSDPGFDNPLNPTVPPSGEPFDESFRYYLDWGDGPGTIHLVSDTNGAPGVDSTGMFGGGHTYNNDGSYTVTVRLADDNMGAYSNSALFVNGTAGIDYVEQLFSVEVAVPEPAAGLLAVIGLTCAFTQRRRPMRQTCT